MNNVLIRKANKDDLVGILDLNFALFKKEFEEFDDTLNIKWAHSKAGREYFSKRISGIHSFVAVAVSNNAIVGYICGGLHDSPIRADKNAELENMMVTDRLRGQNIGSRLVKEFFKWCKSEGMANVLVTASSGNLPGIRFYKKFGFNDLEVNLRKKLK